MRYPGLGLLRDRLHTRSEKTMPRERHAAGWRFDLATRRRIPPSWWRKIASVAVDLGRVLPCRGAHRADRRRAAALRYAREFRPAARAYRRRKWVYRMFKKEA